MSNDRTDLDRILGIFAHDIITPIKGIRNLSELLTNNIEVMLDRGENSDWEKNINVYKASTSEIGEASTNLLHITTLLFECLRNVEDSLDITTIVNTVILDEVEEIEELNVRIHKEFKSSPVVFKGNPRLIAFCLSFFLKQRLRGLKKSQVTPTIAFELAKNEDQIILRYTDSLAHAIEWDNSFNYARKGPCRLLAWIIKYRLDGSITRTVMEDKTIKFEVIINANEDASY